MAFFGGNFFGGGFFSGDVPPSPIKKGGKLHKRNPWHNDEDVLIAVLHSYMMLEQNRNMKGTRC